MYVVVHLLNHVQLFAIPWTAACQVSLSFTISWSFLKLMSIESVMPSKSHPLSSPSPPAFSLSQHQCLFQLFPSGGQNIGPSASASVSLSNEYSELISSRIDLISLQSKGLSSLLEHTSKALILQCSAFFMVQISHLYMTTGETIALIIWNFVGKVRSLLFNMLSRFIIAFLPWSKHLLISWLQSLSTVILEPPKIKSVTVSTFPHPFAMK